VLRSSLTGRDSNITAPIEADATCSPEAASWIHVDVVLSSSIVNGTDKSSFVGYIRSTCNVTLLFLSSQGLQKSKLQLHIKGAKQLGDRPNADDDAWRSVQAGSALSFTDRETRRRKSSSYARRLNEMLLSALGVHAHACFRNKTRRELWGLSLMVVIMASLTTDGAVLFGRVNGSG